MWLNFFRFTSIFFTALALGAGLAHVFELLNKIDLPAKDYLVVQQIYSGWSLLGIVVFASLLSTLILTILLYRNGKNFKKTLIAFICIVLAQADFWAFTFPVNQKTNNWTMLPANWMYLRQQWEYSHAAGTFFNLIAFVSLILAMLPEKNQH
jgi:hypothetical protein